jgi:FixJ family two-component response regulator
LAAAPVISIIDDDEAVRAGLNNLVASLGYNACMFASAEAYLQSAELHNTWCVIADVRMPTMSGVELQLHLRKQGSGVPFIFITSVPEESVRKCALDGGAICFLGKPFDDDALINCLNKAIELRRSGTNN